MHALRVLILAIHLFLPYALAAAPLGSSSSLPTLSLLSENEPSNGSPPSNLTLSAKLNLPADPNYYTVTSSDEQLKMWSFGYAVRHSSTISTLQAASRDVAFNIKKGSKIGTTPLHWESGNVHLVLHVTHSATWEVMGTTVRGLREWFEKWDYVECDFDIGQVGFDRLFGTGSLVQFESNVQ